MLQILRWISFARRPLYWRELNAYLSIDLENGVADPDFRLVVSADDLCGSLVDVTVAKNLAGEASPDEVVNLAHFTVKE